MSELHVFGEMPINPIPSISELREECLKRSQKRMPIWRFKAGNDLLVSLQPKPCEPITPLESAYGYKQVTARFVGNAVMADQIPNDGLTKKPKDHNCWPFEIIAKQGDCWTLRCRGGSWSPSRKDRQQELRERVSNLITGKFFHRLTPQAMLSANCLLCGKGLSDPASMARWIGPECYGSSTLIVHKIFVCEAA